MHSVHNDIMVLSQYQCKVMLGAIDLLWPIDPSGLVLPWNTLTYSGSFKHQVAVFTRGEKYKN